MQSLLNPKYTSYETQSKLKKFSCVGEMSDYIFEEYKDNIFYM